MSSESCSKTWIANVIDECMYWWINCSGKRKSLRLMLKIDVRCERDGMIICGEFQKKNDDSDIAPHTGDEDVMRFVWMAGKGCYSSSDPQSMEFLLKSKIKERNISDMVTTSKYTMIM